MKNFIFLSAILAMAVIFYRCDTNVQKQVANDGQDRTILPLKEPIPATYKELDVRNATPPERFEVKAPKNAPNVLLVLIDDLGFAGTSKFGGPVQTPTFDRIANEGVFYNNFHTTAVCSPTRAALKSGRNHHENNMGSIIETGTAFPGNTGSIPDAVAPVAEILRLNGYSTAAFGKMGMSLPHGRPMLQVRLIAGQTNQGFEKFYGFLGGETNQWAPFIYNGVTPVELPEDNDYHFSWKT